MSKALIALVTAVAALAMIAAGCGGSSDETDGSGGTGSVSKAEFLNKGNAICADGEKEVEKGVEKFAKENNLSENKGPTEKQVEELAEDLLVPSVRKQLTELQALEVPSGDAEEVEAIFAAVESALKKTEEDPGVFTEEEGAGPFVKANKLARAYGLVECGSEPS